jgi:hypothetical protein
LSCPCGVGEVEKEEVDAVPVSLPVAFDFFMRVKPSFS